MLLLRKGNQPEGSREVDKDEVRVFEEAKTQPVIPH